MKSSKLLLAVYLTLCNIVIFEKPPNIIAAKYSCFTVVDYHALNVGVENHFLNFMSFIHKTQQNIYFCGFLSYKER